MVYFAFSCLRFGCWFETAVGNYWDGIFRYVGGLRTIGITAALARDPSEIIERGRE